MSFDKQTNAGWPDPTDWVNRLYQAMAERQEIYETETNALNRRNMAGGMLGLVLTSLMELPAFKNDSVHLPLKDLMIFLSDLDRGRDHLWSTPVNFGGTSATTTAQSELKIWVKAVFCLLRENSHKPVEAYRHIADGLNATGRTGRGGKPVRWRLVQQWCKEQEVPQHVEKLEKIRLWWLDFRFQTSQINIVDGRSQPVPEKEIVGLFANLVWTLPHLRDLSISGGSE